MIRVPLPVADVKKYALQFVRLLTLFVCHGTITKAVVLFLVLEWDSGKRYAGLRVCQPMAGIHALRSPGRTPVGRR